MKGYAYGTKARGLPAMRHLKPCGWRNPHPTGTYTRHWYRWRPQCITQNAATTPEQHGFSTGHATCCTRAVRPQMRPQAWTLFRFCTGCRACYRNSSTPLQQLLPRHAGCNACNRHVPHTASARSAAHDISPACQPPPARVVSAPKKAAYVTPSASYN